MRFADPQSISPIAHGDLLVDRSWIRALMTCGRAWRAERTAVFSGTLLFRAGCFCVDLYSFSKQFHLFAVRCLFRSIILFLLAFFGLRILVPVLFESLEVTGFPVFLAVFFCLPTDFLLLRALVTRFLHRLCFVLCRGFLCLRLT